MKLSGEDLGRLRTVVIDAVTSEDELERFVSDRMSLRLEKITERGNLDRVVFGLLNWLEANALTDKFIDALIKERPLLTEPLTGLRDIAAARPKGLEELRTDVGRLRGWLVSHPWLFAAVSMALVLAVGWTLVTRPVPPSPVDNEPSEPLAAVNAPHIWKNAFVVRGERIVYASPDNIYGVSKSAWRRRRNLS
jgi:hypothetical protein